MTSKERSGSRDFDLKLRQALYSAWDAEFSERRRSYGKNVPAQNADLIVHSQGFESSESSYLEYDHFEIMAIGEYKRNTWVMPNTYRQEPWAKILVSLAKPHKVPAFLAIYCPEFWWYRCYPLNEYAEKYFGDGELLTEREFVSKLYDMRQRTAPVEILFRLNDHKPVTTIEAPVSVSVPKTSKLPPKPSAPAQKRSVMTLPRIPPMPTRVTQKSNITPSPRRVPPMPKAQLKIHSQ